jgi:hypothetical protein
VVLGTCAIAGCSANAFSCQDDSQCGQGWCEAQGWCSFPDATCESGRRFGKHSGAGLAGHCVPLVPDDVAEDSTGSPSTTSSVTDSTTTLQETSTDTGVDDTTHVSDSTGISDTSTGGGPITVTVGPLQVGSDEDDGQMYRVGNQITWLPSGEPGDLGFAGEYPQGARYFGYFRFELPIELTADAIIDEAVLSLYGRTPWMWVGEYRMGVWVQDSDDAPVVDMPDAMPVIGPMDQNAAIRLRQDAVPWPERGGLAWSVDGWNDTPDLGTLLTAHVATHDGLAAGSHLQLWIAMYEPENVTAEIGFVEYAASPELAARLEFDVTQ